MHASGKVMIEQGEEAGANFAVDVRRTREQCPQNGCETGAMMPISPMPSSNVNAGQSRCGALVILDQRRYSFMLLENLIQRDHDVGRPHAIFFQRHEFDEADHDAFFAGETPNATI